jgi:hypothetical protein
VKQLAAGPKVSGVDAGIDEEGTGLTPRGRRVPGGGVLREDPVERLDPELLGDEGEVGVAVREDHGG